MLFLGLGGFFYCTGWLMETTESHIAPFLETTGVGFLLDAVVAQWKGKASVESK